MNNELTKLEMDILRSVNLGDMIVFKAEKMVLVDEDQQLYKCIMVRANGEATVISPTGVYVVYDDGEMFLEPSEILDVKKGGC